MMDNPDTAVTECSSSGTYGRGMAVHEDPTTRASNSMDIDVPSVMQQHSDVFWYVVMGNMSNLPSMPTNTVRIFLSSTFSDFKAERNHLIQHAYPQLEEFCASHGVDFQVVDMRWGVTDDVVNDHQVAPLCISEIITCQKLSCGPSFVVLLGDRYGWQGFQPRIDATEFDTLMADVQNSDDIELLKTWFKRDDNAVPPEYVLQPIHVNLKDFESKDLDNRAADRSAWTEVSGKLQTILRSCAQAASEKGTFTEEQKQKYFISVTEEEILQGVCQSADPTTSVMCYKRSLQGISQAPVTDNLDKFIDCRNKPKVIDKEAESQRKRLQERLQPLLHPSNIQHYKIKWTDVLLEESPEEEHKAYLKKFGEDFTRDVKKLVSEKVAANLKMCQDTKWKSLYNEVLHHAHFGKIKCEVFYGREGEVELIKEYLLNGQNGGHPPLILHGVSGIGKTALMGYVGSKLHSWFGSKCCAILRFLGTSPLSSNIRETLRSVIEQISMGFNLPIPHECSLEMFGHLRRLLSAFIEQVSENTNDSLVILLDSVDQLYMTSGAHRMVWLPKVLPKNVYIIVSMLTEDCMNTLINTRKRLPDHSNYIEISPLSEDTGDYIIAYHLNQNKRQLTVKQKEVVLNAFRTLRHPLFLKLLIDEAKMWTSYLPSSALPILIPECAADAAVKAAIVKLFEGMEAKHGVTFVQHALGYLTCGNVGLTEIEIEDVLSCDDEVLNEVYQYHEPPLVGVVRIPSLMWARLENALKEYISERRVDGKVVLGWYHRQFWEAAEMRYLQPNSKKQERHDLLAKLFLQENGMKKTITLRYFQDRPIHDADRRVRPQPLEVTNHRKLHSVPYHMYHSGRHKQLISHCLINFEWLLLQISAFGINCVIRDLEDMNVHSDITFFRKFLENSFDALQKDPNLLAYNIVERLQDCSYGNEVLEAIVADAKRWLYTTEVPLMVPTHQIQLQKANSPQLFSTVLGYDAVLTSDDSKFVCSWSEKKIQTLCLKTRDIVAVVPISKPTPVTILPDNQHFVFVRDKQIAKCEIDTGDVVTVFDIFVGEYEKITIKCLATSNNCKFAAVGIKFGKPKHKRAWHREFVIYLIDLDGGKVLNNVSVSGRKGINSLMFVQNDELIVGISKNSINVYNVSTLAMESHFTVMDDLAGDTFKKFESKKMITGLCSTGPEVKIVLFDYGQMDVITSKNVHIECDQKAAVPFGMHCKSDLSWFLVGSSGTFKKDLVSSICVWGHSDGKADAYVKIRLCPRGNKAPTSLVSTNDLKYAIIGWQCGHIVVIDLELRHELLGIPGHGHAVNFMNLLNDGHTLITVSQDQTLKVWDLVAMIHQMELASKGIGSQSDHRCLHEKEQCLNLITCDQFIASVPQSSLHAPQFWNYANGHLIQSVTAAYQNLYMESIKNNKLDFPMEMHGIITELPGREILIYERKSRDTLTMLVTEGYKDPKVLVHHRFLNTFFRLIVVKQNQSVLYVVHDGLLGIYNITTLEPIKQITMSPISKDVGRIDCNNGKKRLMSYKIAVTYDERYFLIINTSGSAKYMDCIDIQKGENLQRIHLSKYIPQDFLRDGVYFMCKDKTEELLLYSAQRCLQKIGERGRDYDYRCLVITGKFLSKDRCFGYSIDNTTYSIYLWQVDPLQLVHTLRGNEHDVMSADISSDNRFLVSGSRDNTVRLWSLESGAQICMFHMFEVVETVLFSPSMTHVAVHSCCAPQRKRGVSLELKNIV